ncbi:matrixin family metalloprotease [Massilia niastensis]|uniref:matrixin family metalloprotease n=1 Tax=Massilia niastensis TaxID=544911 RepID=UPI0003752E86|nr:matrixin family metalloprotease [Massilia niastensis]
MNPLIKVKQILATAFLAAASIALPSHAMVVGPSDKPHTIVLADKDGSPILGSDFVPGPTVPGKWGSPVFGTGATVTWSLMPTGTSCAAEVGGCTITALDDFMPTGYLSAITAAFAAWSAVADIVFTQVADNGVPFNAPGTVADIRIGGHIMDGALGVLAHGYYPPVNGTSAAGDIHFDVAEIWKLGFGGAGFDIFQVAAHEIGHAIGLAHTAVPNSLMNPFYTEAFSGPQADDIAGAQFIYGPAHPVPVPGTLMLLSLGLLVLGVARRRA